MDWAAKTMVLVSSVSALLCLSFVFANALTWSLPWQSQYYYMALIDLVHDADRVITALSNKLDNLRKEVQRLKDVNNPNTVTVTERRASKDYPPGRFVKQAIEDYKKSPGFEMGLVRMGRVSLEYDY
ncbi:hypothetical protein B296_00047333 [Ensete ventricosum]|uniref:Uncharacterized protein n=1 Tax=Ensete ventricosum TaxID=4639 RepID=A0A426Z025_ENSVE|nr:hypothetical protein B296_00047333 [Ensete ventricosum]